MTEAPNTAPPLDLSVVRGSPTPEELAAVVAVLQAAAARPDHRPAPPAAAPSGWERARRPLRQPLHPGVWR